MTLVGHMRAITLVAVLRIELRETLALLLSHLHMFTVALFVLIDEVLVYFTFFAI